MIIADRFVVRDADADAQDSCGRRARVALDLASGATVWLLERSAGARDEQLRWSARCARLEGLWHPSLAPLVDFGFVGADALFEAWLMSPDGGSADDGSRAHAARRDGRREARRAVTALLRQRGLTTAPLDGGVRALASLIGRDVAVVPEGTEGFEIEAGPTIVASAPAATHVVTGPDVSYWRAALPASFGLVLQPRAIARALEDALEEGRDGKPRWAWIRSSAGDGLSTLLRRVACAARRLGFAPLSGRVLADALVRRRLGDDWPRRLLTDRRVLLMCDARHNAMSRDLIARLAIEVAAISPRPHLFVTIEESGAASSGAWPIDPIPAGDLARAVCRTGGAAALSDAVIERAARRADGRPGMFVATLRRACTVVQPSTAAERPGARWGAPSRSAAPPDEAGSSTEAVRERAVSTLSPALVQAHGWLSEAIDLAARGRHAPAERLLRRAIGRCLRREDHAHAAQGALALGRLLLVRGRCDAAERAFDQARRGFDRVNRTVDAVRAAVGVGMARSDACRLAESESVLRAARAAAERLGRSDLRRFADAVLARCLLWQGRADEAQAVLAPEAARAAEAPADADGWIGRRGAVQCMVARVALARHDHVVAVRSASAAIALARSADDRAAASLVMATVQSALGDDEAFERRRGEATMAAREAHAPLLLLRVRAMHVEHLLARGRRADARARIARLERSHAHLAGELLRRRLSDLRTAACVGDAQEGDGAAGEIDAVERTTQDRARVSVATLPTSPLVADLVEILSLCHDADDDERALERVCERVRERARGARASIVTVTGARLAGDRRMNGSSTASRAIDAGIVIRPVRLAGGWEAAAPIRCGGAPLAALAVRWTIDESPEPGAIAVIEAAAAACAPVVRGAMALTSASAPANTAAEMTTELLGVSQPIAALRARIQQAAPAPYPVLIHGESGSGKELVARALYRLSPRRDRRFCVVNCAALTDELLESELFGHARGAFTGALTERRGLFEEAHEGVLFLDEVGELSPRAQAKLLRVMQDGEVRRVGENFTRTVDVRVVAATNRVLSVEASAGRFRQDLLYRLDVIALVTPPLRDRADDIAVLADYFWRRAAARTGSRAMLSRAAIAALTRYDWPGNVRELQNVVSNIAVTAPGRGVIGAGVLPDAIARAAAMPPRATLEEARRQFEERFVRAALARADGRRSQAAADLGVTRQGLRKLIERLGLETRAAAFKALKD